MKKSMRDTISHAAQDLDSWANAVSKMAIPPLGDAPEPFPQRDQLRERQLVARLHPHRMNLRVEGKIQETPSTVTLRLDRTDGELPPFRAGQYLNLYVSFEGVETSRPYSISSAPGEPYLDLTIKEKPGGFVSPYLCSRLWEGDELKSSGPEGWFRHEPLIDPKELVFLAGGSGITPFMSMVRQQVRDGFSRRITLLYGCRNEDEVIFGAELRRLAEEHEQLELAVVLSEPASGSGGFLDHKLIRDRVGGVDDKQFFICGPEVMIPFCLEALEDLGVPLHRRRVETFGPPEDVTSLPGWPADLGAGAPFTVEVEGRGEIQATAGEPLINSLERAGLVIPATCRSGACSACRSRLLQGEVFCPPGVGIRQWDRENGYIHPCMAYPLSNLRLRLP